MLGAALAWLLPPPDGASPGLDEHTYALLGLSAYAAVVLAFLGAVHWGRALQAGERATFPMPGRWRQPCWAPWVR
ncbi:MAG: hypothetical protein U1E77_03250 [Inhella sp.]